LKQRILRINSQMMFEYPLDIGSNRNRLHGIAKQIADHANIACMRQFDDHGKVGAMLLERCMRGMPDALQLKMRPRGATSIQSRSNA